MDVKRKAKLLESVCFAFDIKEVEIYAELTGLSLPNGNGHNKVADAEIDLWARIPKEGWLATYAEYTRFIESPLSYNLFASLCALGCAAGRKVWKDKGFFKIYGNYSTLLIGPPAIAKTTAANIARWFIEKSECCPIFADAITPQAIVASMLSSGTHQFICADELAVFLSKQRYNEGLVTLMNRLLEAPDKHEVETLARSKETLLNVCISMIGASTPSLLANSTPEQTSSSGFLSRFVIVTEHSTSRVFWQPVRGSHELENRMLMTLDRLKQFSGEITYTPEADKWGKEWYEQRKKQVAANTDEVSVEIGSRLPIHLERIAMLLHIADHNDRVVCKKCFETAGVLIDYANKNLPHTVSAIKHSTKVHDTEYVLDQIRKAGGACDHSKLLRMCAGRGFNAASFRAHISTLREQSLIREELRGALRFYIMEEPTDASTT